MTTKLTAQERLKRFLDENKRQMDAIHLDMMNRFHQLTLDVEKEMKEEDLWY